MTIRPADAADLDTIIRLVRDAYTPYIARIGKPPGPMLDDYAARIREHAIWVLAEPDVIGLIVLLPRPDHLLLDNIVVDPRRHGQGHGGTLLRFADAEARRRGYRELHLYTHEKMTENIALYSRLGWQETGRGEQDGFSRVFFRRTFE